MLKINFSLKSNVLLKNSNARLIQINKRIFYFNFLFFSVFKFFGQSPLKTTILLKSKFRSNRLVLMRSPFHYKVSKTLIGVPAQKLIISLIIPYKSPQPLLFNSALYKIMRDFNKNNCFVIQSIKIKQI